MANQFWLFAHEDYYPSGGVDDLQGRFDTLEEAKQAAAILRYDTAYVVDTADAEIVWSKW